MLAGNRVNSFVRPMGDFEQMLKKGGLGTRIDEITLMTVARGGAPDARLLEVPPDARPKLLVGLAIEMVHRRRDRFVDGDEEVLERGAEGFGGHGAHGLR